MGQRGFSLIEVALASALTLAVAAAIFAVLDAGAASFLVQPEAADMQQRARVAARTLYTRLVMAGAGMTRGPNRGPLIHYLPPIVPYRRGTGDEDPPGSFMTTAITVLYVPQTVAQTTLTTNGPAEFSGDVGVSNGPGCPVGDTLCGFEPGMTVALYDATGQHDTFTITSAQPAALHLETTGANPIDGRYVARTATISEVVHVVFSLRSDPRTGSYQLVSRDGGIGAELPVVGHVVALGFEYYGDPMPPTLNGKPLDDPVGPWTTYGPAPPQLTEQIPSRGYPAGENCTFVVDPGSGTQVPRLANLAANSTDGLIPINESLLGDGPWCPDATSPNRWDADLLRIRTIGVTVRVEAAIAALRGPASALFTRAGTSRSGKRWLPDQQVTFSVAPRNMGR
jgi:hypothetical protein